MAPDFLFFFFLSLFVFPLLFPSTRQPELSWRPIASRLHTRDDGDGDILIAAKLICRGYSAPAIPKQLTPKIFSVVVFMLMWCEKLEQPPLRRVGALLCRVLGSEWFPI